MKKKLIIGNWKMNPVSGKEADKMFKAIAKGVSAVRRTEVVVCPPFLYLERVKHFSRKIALGGQNAYLGDTGAFTGEVSPEMLYNAGARYVILGHSERRALGEDNSLINKKIKSALASGLIPILCVGETERDLDHKYFDTVKLQVRECLVGVKKASIPKIIIAYEPVWAISSTLNRRDATPSDAREMAVFIRKVLADMSSPDIASKTRVIYGGSVNERDAGGFLEHGEVDGVLSGRASLNPEKFIKIVKTCEALKS